MSTLDTADYTEAQIAQYNILVPLLDDSVSVYAGVHGSENLAEMIVEALHAAAPPVDTTEFEAAVLSYCAITGGFTLDRAKWDEGYTAPEVIEEGTAFYQAEISKRFQHLIDLYVKAATR